MKIRSGFVSNSSSSSFVILKKDKSLSREEMIKKTMEVFREDTGGFGDDEKAYYMGQAEEYADNGQYILIKDTVEYGGEESVEKVIKTLLSKLDVDSKSITFEWEDQ